MKKIEMSINANAVSAELNSAKIKLAEKRLEKNIKEATDNGLTWFSIPDGCYDKYTEHVLKEWGYSFEVIGSNSLHVEMAEPEDYNKAARHNWCLAEAAYATAYRRRIEIMRHIESKIKQAVNEGYSQEAFEYPEAVLEWISEILEENGFKTKHKDLMGGEFELVVSW